MKGVGWVVILLGLLGITYLLTRDLQSMKGERDGKVVVEPLQRAKEAAEAAQKATRQTTDGVEKADSP